MTSVKTVILDVDGTLIDSNEAHVMAWQDALTEFGLHAEDAEIRRRIGMGGDQLLPSLLRLSADSDIGRKVSARRGQIFRSTYLPALRAFPQVRELLLELRGAGLRLVVATSAEERDLRLLLKRGAIDDLLPDVVTADDAENSKPEADLIHAALAKAGARPGEAVMVGDTPYDLEAARRAGVRAIGFTCGGWDPEGLAGAVEIYADAADLRRRLTGSLLSGAADGAARDQSPI